MRKLQRSRNGRRQGQNRLRNDIVAGALIVTFSLLVIFAGFTYWQGYTILTEEALKSLEAVAAVQEKRVEAYVSTGITDLELTTNRPILIEAMRGLGDSGDPSHLGDISRLTEAAKQAAANTEAIYVFDIETNLLSGPTQVELQIDIPAAFLTQAKSGIVSGLIVQTPDDRFLHVVAGPVLADDEPIGLVAVGQSTDALFAVASDHIGLGDSGETIIAAPGAERPVYIAPLRFAANAVLRPIPTSIEALPMTDALAGLETADPHGVDYRGREVFAITRQVEGPDWGIVVKKDRSEVLAPLDEFALIALGVLSVALVLAYFLTDRFTEWVIRPVRKVTETAKAIAAGRRELTVGSDRHDEIGELAKAFDEMSIQLNALTAELEERVAERTHELEERNAELAQVMEDKETFLAGVSHEVRSPLTAMIGFLDLVNDADETLSSGDRTEMLETVSRQADDVLNLIEDLLASARVEAGTLHVVSVQCNLGAQVRQVAESIAANTRIDVQLDGEDVLADADPARVRQIIRNLLTNADRYGGRSVVLELSRVDGVVCLQVRDNGPGVPEQDREEIFEAYGQSMSTRKVDGSVGLGLHVSRELARLMGGDLTYDYVSGWSVFSVFLPEHYEMSDLDPATETVAASSTR